MYQVKWKDSDELTWEPYENVSHLTHLLSKFTAKVTQQAQSELLT